MNGPVVINERDNGFAHVQLSYHGACADPKLTLHVLFSDEEQRVIEVAVPEDRAMEAFNHPFAFLATDSAARGDA